MRLFKRNKVEKLTQLDEIYENLKILNKKVKDIEMEIRQLRRRKIDNNLRVGVFVDIQNMFYSAKKLYNSRVDYVRLLKYTVKNRRLIKAIAYIIDNPEVDQSSFISLLSHHAFEVKRKPLIQRMDGSQKGDCDMEIALDILSAIDLLDVVALVSGDGDFVKLAEVIKGKGSKIEVYGFPETSAIQLKEIADEFFPITEALLYRYTDEKNS